MGTVNPPREKDVGRDQKSVTSSSPFGALTFPSSSARVRAPPRGGGALNSSALAH